MHLVIDQSINQSFIPSCFVYNIATETTCIEKKKKKEKAIASIRIK